MIFILSYLFVGFASYWFVAPSDGITFDDVPKWAIAIASLLWAVIWLPVLLYKIGNR